MQDIFFVYALLDPRKPGHYEYNTADRRMVFKYEPFYIGKGKGKRPYSHVKEAQRSKQNTRKLNLIRKLLRLGLQPIVRIGNQRMAEELAFAYEKELIAAIGRADKGLGPLLNRDGGGRGVRVTRMSKEEYEKHVYATRRAKKAWLQRITEDEHKAYLLRVCEGVQKYYERTSTKERRAKAAKIIQTRATFSEERKALYLERKSKSAKEWYAGLSDKEKQQMKANQDASKGNYPLRMCCWCGSVGKGGNMLRYHFDECEHKGTLSSLEEPWKRIRHKGTVVVPPDLIGRRRTEVPDSWHFLWRE